MKNINTTHHKRAIMIGRLIFRLRYLLLALFVTIFVATLFNMTFDSSVVLFAVIIVIGRLVVLALLNA